MLECVMFQGPKGDTGPDGADGKDGADVSEEPIMLSIKVIYYLFCQKQYCTSFSKSMIIEFELLE